MSSEQKIVENSSILTCILNEHAVEIALQMRVCADFFSKCIELPVKFLPSQMRACADFFSKCIELPVKFLPSSQLVIVLLIGRWFARKAA